MKTLANCTPREFLRQTNRIRVAAERWLRDTDILALRRRLPEGEFATEDEKREAMAAQALINAGDMLAAALDRCPDQTAELLGLMCFIEPEELDEHPMSELLEAVTALLNSREVLDFFISLARLARARILSTPGR